MKSEYTHLDRFAQAYREKDVSWLRRELLLQWGRSMQRLMTDEDVLEWAQEYLQMEG